VDTLFVFFCFKRRHTISHEKDQNNMSDIMGITPLTRVAARHYPILEHSRSKRNFFGPKNTHYRFVKDHPSWSHPCAFTGV